MGLLANIPAGEGSRFPFSALVEWDDSVHREEAAIVIPSASSTAWLEAKEIIEYWESGTTSGFLSRQAQIALLERIYAFRRPAEVTEFLESHPFLGSLLLEAYGQIRKHFGLYPFVFLEVITDPEATDDRELYAFIASRLLPHEALERLDRLDSEWWLAALDRAQGNLCLDVEFV